MSLIVSVVFFIFVHGLLALADNITNRNNDME